MAEGNISHIPVMVEGVLEFFNLPEAPLQHPVPKNEKKIFMDLTLGAGGHAKEIIKRGGYVVGFEIDPALVKIARKTLEDVCRVDPACPADNFDGCFSIFNDNFTNATAYLGRLGIEAVDGALFDLGVSSVHMDDPTRGFSFKDPRAVLDMRLSSNLGVSASDILNALPQKGLEQLFDGYLEFRKSRSLSAEIIEFRKVKKIRSVGDFLEIIQKSGIEKYSDAKKIHPATLPFMALRIAVNTELQNLEQALPGVFEKLKIGGVMQVICFHSSEDRIVKRFFSDLKNGGRAEVLTEKPVRPTINEIKINPRSRSAKLRAIKKYEDSDQ